MKRKIGIVGGGNLGSVLAVKFSQENDVTLYISNPNKLTKYRKDMQVYNEENDYYYTGKILSITNSLEDLVNNSEIIFITYPAFLFKSFAAELIPLLKKGQHLVFVPGSGGAELAFKGALKKGVTISGLQRVHAVARIIKTGELVRESGVRSSLKVASIPNSFNKCAAKCLEELYKLPVEQLDNYLNITLINSNSILHTSRLYSIFKDYPSGVETYNSLPLFYEDWDIESANLLIDMDKELFSIIDELGKNGLIVDKIVPIAKHYDSEDALGMMNKIKSIKSFKGITTPSVKTENGEYLPDLSSRYFIADFPYGLDIIRSFGKLLNVKTPNMDKVSKWYKDTINYKEKEFSLSDFGFNDLNSICEFYK